MIGPAPNLAKVCQARYDQMYQYSDIYQQVWDETESPDDDFVKSNANDIGDLLSLLFNIANAPFINEAMAVEQLADIKELLIAFRTEYCEQEAEKRAYPK